MLKNLKSRSPSHLDPLLFFIVLLGLLPVISNTPLFSWQFFQFGWLADLGITDIFTINPPADSSLGITNFITPETNPIKYQNQWILGTLGLWNFSSPTLTPYLRPGFLTLFSVLFIAGLLICLKNKRYLGLAALLPLLFLLLSYFLILPRPLLPFINDQALMLLFSGIAFAYFICCGHIRSLPFVVVVLVTGLLYGFQVAATFALISMLVKFIYLAVTQNLKLLFEMGLLKSSWLALKSALYWSPLLLLVFPAAILTSKLNTGATSLIYEHTFIDNHQDGEFQKNVNASIDSFLAPEMTSLIEAMYAEKIKARGNLGVFADRIASVYEQKVPETLPIFRPKDCTWYDVACFTVINPLKKSLKRGYQKSRKEIKADIVQYVKTKSSAANANLDQVVEDTKLLIFDKFNALRSTMKQAVLFFFNLFGFISLVLNVLFILVIIKSYLYVFSRVAFAEGNHLFVSLNDADKPLSKCSLKKCGNQYHIPEHAQHNFFIARTFEPSGRPPKFALPQLHTALFTRLRRGAWAMNKITMKGRDGAVDFKSVGGNEFVEWELMPEDEVIFDYKNFVGMSEGIQLSTIISLRLSTLLMGRVFFRAAKGPGKLILLTQGEPIAGNDDKTKMSIAISRIAAWQKETRFTVESELNLLDVFMSGVYLKKPGDEWILIDADQKGRSSTGISRFIKSFLLPI